MPISDLTSPVARQIGANLGRVRSNMDRFIAGSIARRNYEMKVAKYLADIENRELEVARSTLSSVMENLNNAETKIEKDHYMKVAESFYGQLTDRQKQSLWPLVQASPLDPQVRKVQAGIEKLRASGQRLPGDTAKMEKDIPTDQINVFDHAVGLFEEADSIYKIQKLQGLDPMRKSFINLGLTQEIETPAGKKTERLWAYRSDPNAIPSIMTETEMNWAGIEKKKGLEAGHISQHQGHIMIDTPVYQNGLYGVNRYIQSAIPGEEGKMTVQFVPDKSYQDRELNEAVTVRSENRAQIRKEMDEIASSTMIGRLLAQGNMDEEEALKTRAGQVAVWKKEAMGPRGLFSKQPALSARYVAQQLEQIWPNTTVVIDPPGEYGWRGLSLLHPLESFTTLFNRDYYMDQPGGGGFTAIPNSKRIQLPTADPGYNAEVIVDFNGKTPVFRSAEQGGRYYPTELQNFDALKEFYKTYQPTDKQKDTWKYINPAPGAGAYLKEAGKLSNKLVGDKIKDVLETVDTLTEKVVGPTVKPPVVRKKIH